MAKFVLRFSKIMSLSFALVITHLLVCNGVVASSPIGNLGAIYTTTRGNGTKPSSAIFETYQTNIRSFLSEIPPSGTPSFYNTSVGESSPSKVYGSYICRGDLSPQHCQDCVLNVTKYLENNYLLFNQDEYYQELYSFTDECMIHFANHSILNGAYVKDDVVLPGDSGPGGSSGAPNKKELNQTLSNALDMTISLAAGSSSKFATNVVDVIGSNDKEKLYILVQCTPDLSSGNCSACLNNLYSGFVSYAGGDTAIEAIHLSCMIKYNTQSFFDNSSAYGSMPGYTHVYVVLMLLMYFLS